jgi:hypothetical protein
MACPVCFGGDDPVVRESLNAGIGVLLGVTGIVLGCFARFFLSLAKRSREAAHLVGDGAARLKPDTTAGEYVASGFSRTRGVVR